MTGLPWWCYSVHIGGGSSADSKNISRCHLITRRIGSELYVAGANLFELGRYVSSRHGDVHECSEEGSAVCPHPHRRLSSPRYIKKIDSH